jgi:hypothetical protein
VTIGERQAGKTWGVAAAPKKKYLVTMNNFKNLLIAILTGLLALSLFTQPAQSASKSKEAKAMEYQVCLHNSWGSNPAMFSLMFSEAIKTCAKHRP